MNVQIARGKGNGIHFQLIFDKAFVVCLQFFQCYQLQKIKTALADIFGAFKIAQKSYLKQLGKSSVFMSGTQHFEIHITLTELAFHCRCKFLPIVVSLTYGQESPRPNLKKIVISLQHQNDLFPKVRKSPHFHKATQKLDNEKNPSDF